MKSSAKGVSINISILRTDIPEPSALKQLSRTHAATLKRSIRRLQSMNLRNLDDLVHRLHDEAFSVYDCLNCANCCRSISPAIRHSDVNEMAVKLKIKPSAVVETYLYLDEEGDYVFRKAPCPFIDGENYCNIYSHRPKACREYPHTDRTRFYQILSLSLKNAEVCPVVFAILKKLEQA
ncbi:MAG TPA: YkgJ family cysteine cluster protein [Lentimicrobium sp.]|nr:YkgJ family cysteine cluster protein [Lentimicrobium sp.]